MHWEIYYLPANTGDARGTGLIPGSGRSPGGGNSNPLQYSYLENPVDRGAWRATVHGVAESPNTTKQLNINNNQGKDRPPKKLRVLQASVDVERCSLWMGLSDSHIKQQQELMKHIDSKIQAVIKTV